MADFKIGDKAKIIGNQSGHRFQMYETVEITGIPGAHPENAISGYSVKGEKRVGFVLTKDLEFIQTKAKIEIINAIELDPSKNYLFVFDRTSLSLDDMHKLQNYLKQEKINVLVAIGVHGKPSEILKVIEDKPKSGK